MGENTSLSQVETFKNDSEAVVSSARPSAVNKGVTALLKSDKDSSRVGIGSLGSFFWCSSITEALQPFSNSMASASRLSMVVSQVSIFVKKVTKSTGPGPGLKSGPWQLYLIIIIIIIKMLWRAV
jgi:hypothetical protein